jgi:hypothetical protein
LSLYAIFRVILQIPTVALRKLEIAQQWAQNENYGFNAICLGANIISGTQESIKSKAAAGSG